jgi:transposase
MAFSLSIRGEICSMVGMGPQYIINLSKEERLGLEELLARKRLSPLKAQRIRVLLKADDGLTDSEVAEEVGVGTASVERIRKRAVLEGVEAALDRRPQKGISRAPKLDGRAEAHLVTLACSEPPQGFSRWTLAMLGD